MTMAAGAASAGAADPMTDYYTNTQVCEIQGHSECREWYEPNGKVRRFWYEERADGSFAVSGREGDYRVTGKPDAYRLCIQWDGETKQDCQPFQPLRLGEKRDVVRKTGQFAGLTETVSLVAGRLGVAESPRPVDVAQSPMKAWVANTLVCKSEGLFECHDWSEADGSFVQFSYDKRANAGGLSGFVVMNGIWWTEDLKPDGTYLMCRRMPVAPPPRPNDANHGCERWVHPLNKVGDTTGYTHDEGPLRGTRESFVLLAGHK